MKHPILNVYICIPILNVCTYIYSYFKCLHHGCIYTNHSNEAVKKGKRRSTKKSAKKGTIKVERDANAPKRASKSVNLFFNDKKAEIKAKHPKKKHFEMLTVAKVMWKTLSDEQKAPYEAQSKIDQDRADAEMAVYKQTVTALPPVPSQTTSVVPSRKVVGIVNAPKVKGPKGATSSFNLFFMDIKMTIASNRPEWTHEDIIREAVVMWKSLTEQEKAPYEERGKADKVRADRELEEFTGQKRKRDDTEITVASK